MNVEAKKIRLRNAEKDRNYSTCQFADRVFFCATKKLDDIIAKGHWPLEAAPSRAVAETNGAKKRNERHQTVVAAFIIHDSSSDNLECASWGGGTKFLEQIIGKDKQVDSNNW